MLVIGCVLLCLFAVWDLRFASRPVIAPRFLRNRSVVFASLIGFFDFVRSSLHTMPFYLNMFSGLILPYLHLSLLFHPCRQALVTP